VAPIPIQTALLFALLRHGEAYGLQLIDRINEDTGRRLEFTQGVVYPALHKLEREGFVKTRKSEPLPERGGRPRIYYQLTASGQAAAREHLSIINGLTEGLVHAN